MRCSGTVSAIASAWRSRIGAIMRESNGPGAIALTVIVGASRRARCLVKWCSAAFDDVYA